MKLKPFILGFFALICLSGVPAKAQYFYPYWNGPSNAEVGYSYAIASATFKYSYNQYNESTGTLTDTSFSQRVTSKSGFGFSGGYYFPVAKMSEKSKLAIDLTYMYNIYLWDGELFSYAMSNNPNNTVVSAGSMTAEMALPVGVEYKYGCDAMKDKSEPYCASLGAGLYPSMSVTVYKETGGLGFRMRPYVKAEFGFMAGICFKLRATYVMGHSNYINYSDSSPGFETSTTFKSNGTTVLSLILMPFSWKWQKSRW